MLLQHVSCIFTYMSMNCRVHVVDNLNIEHRRQMLEILDSLWNFSKKCSYFVLFSMYFSLQNSHYQFFLMKIQHSFQTIKCVHISCFLHVFFWLRKSQCQSSASCVCVKCMDYMWLFLCILLQHAACVLHVKYLNLHLLGIQMALSLWWCSSRVDIDTTYHCLHYAREEYIGHSVTKSSFGTVWGWDARGLVLNGLRLNSWSLASKELFRLHLLWRK